MAHAETPDIANDRAEKKKIAILLATYNGERYLAEQIESIRAQSCTNWHVYMHDDGSSDGTLEILRAYATKEPERFTYVEDGCRARSAQDFSDAAEAKAIAGVKNIMNAAIKSRGAKGNFFYLLEQVEADYYMFCDQDDVWLPDKIAVTWAKMQEIDRLYPTSTAKSCEEGEKRGTEGEKANLYPAAVFTELRVVDEQKNTICDTMSAYQGLDCSKISFHRLMIQNVVTGCTMMINRVLRDEMLGRRVQSTSGGIAPPVSAVPKNGASASRTTPSETTSSRTTPRERLTSEASAGFIPDYDKIIMHDWWGAMIAAAFGWIAFVPEPTILYRQHGANSVGAKAATSMGYLAKRMAKADEVRESLRLTREQAGEFARCFAQAQAYEDLKCSKLDEGCISLAFNYASLGSKNKLSRLGFYIRHDAWKTNLSRNVGLIIFG